MKSLTVRLFGAMQLQRGRRAVTSFRTQKSKSLLAYLLLHRDTLHRREVLVGIFWGDRADATARKRLRTDLWRLRGILEPKGTRRGSYLTTQNGDIGFNSSTRHWLDVEEFERRVKTAGECPARVAGDAGRLLKEAIELYRGDLLEGMYDDWCVYERERFKALFRSALECLMHLHQEREEWPAAIDYGERLLASDPLLEHVHRDLMRYHYAMGDRPLALRQYQVCVELLQRELQVAPMPETITLCEAMRAGASNV